MTNPKKPKPTEEEKERVRREQESRQIPLPGTQTDKGPPPNWWRQYGQ